MNKVTVDIEGTHYELKDLIWTLKAPCGCWEAVMIVDLNNLDPEQAFKQIVMGDTARETRKWVAEAKRDGRVIEMITRERYLAESKEKFVWGGCQHKTKESTEGTLFEATT